MNKEASLCMILIPELRLAWRVAYTPGGLGMIGSDRSRMRWMGGNEGVSVFIMSFCVVVIGEEDTERIKEYFDN